MLETGGCGRGGVCTGGGGVRTGGGTDDDAGLPCPPTAVPPEAAGFAPEEDVPLGGGISKGALEPEAALPGAPEDGGASPPEPGRIEEAPEAEGGGGRYVGALSITSSEEVDAEPPGGGSERGMPTTSAGCACAGDWLGGVGRNPLDGGLEGTSPVMEPECEAPASPSEAEPLEDGADRVPDPDGGGAKASSSPLLDGTQSKSSASSSSSRESSSPGREAAGGVIDEGMLADGLTPEPEGGLEGAALGSTGTYSTSGCAEPVSLYPIYTKKSSKMLTANNRCLAALRLTIAVSRKCRAVRDILRDAARLAFVHVAKGRRIVAKIFRDYDANLYEKHRFTG